MRRDIIDLLDEIRTLPLAAVLVTAVHREGLLGGVDLPLMEDVVDAATVPVYAAGGASSVSDLFQLADRGVAGTVIGMALYTGALDPRTLALEFGNDN
jgi:phosphoribosylformimino-5-aminoimidazole carboxamide ribotide isomerase